MLGIDLFQRGGPHRGVFIHFVDQSSRIEQYSIFRKITPAKVNKTATVQFKHVT
jgi:hypothetical protein